MPGSCSPWSLRFRFIYFCCPFSLKRCSGDFHFARWRGLPACSNSRRSYFRRSSNSARVWASYSCRVTPGNAAVMLPSAKVVALRSGASTQEALELSTSTGLDRLPVLAPDGQPAGLVNVLDILLERNGNKPLGEYVRRIVTTTDDEPAYRVMQQLRGARRGLAAVVERESNFRGSVAIEDLSCRLGAVG